MCRKMTREEKERVQTDLKSAEERNERLRREVVHLRVKINKMKNLVPLDVSETQKALESLEQKFDVLERRLLKSSQGGNRGARKFAVEQIINMNQLGEISGALRGLRMIAESSLTVSVRKIVEIGYLIEEIRPPKNETVACLDNVKISRRFCRICRPWMYELLNLYHIFPIS
jgi:septal ring factor EnvC (AmiA/AmiB activator)